tara:strand:- start:88616 stop:89119 length:504 start_codon:yes stop_codon:yes gene_type:complete
MKNLLIIFSVITLFTACKNNTEKQEISADEVIHDISYTSFGANTTESDALSSEEMAVLFGTLKPGDTVPVKFRSTVTEVCQSKGCWMKLDLGNAETMVTFKDYAFFMPKDLSGKDVVVNGKAFVSEMSVDDQRHFAEDAGKSPEEIAAITEPKQTLSFEAEGVLLVD